MRTILLYYVMCRNPKGIYPTDLAMKLEKNKYSITR